MFHQTRLFDTVLSLEGESTRYRFSVVYGKINKASTETGLRRVFVLYKEDPVKEQEIGVEVVPEKESDIMTEKTTETPPEPEPAPEPEPEPEPVPVPVPEPEVKPEPEPEVPPIVVPQPEEEIVVAEEPPVVEPEPEPEPEQPKVVVVAEVEVEVEVVEKTSEDEIPKGLEMIFSPETPAFTKERLRVDGTIKGFEPHVDIYIQIEKSTSKDNGWTLWTERGLKVEGDRTSISRPILCSSHVHSSRYSSNVPRLFLSILVPSISTGTSISAPKNRLCMVPPHSQCLTRARFPFMASAV